MHIAGPPPTCKPLIASRPLIQPLASGCHLAGPSNSSLWQSSSMRSSLHNTCRPVPSQYNPCYASDSPICTVPGFGLGPCADPGPGPDPGTGHGAGPAPFLHTHRLVAAPILVPTPGLTPPERQGPCVPHGCPPPGALALPGCPRMTSDRCSSPATDDAVGQTNYQP